MARKDTNKQYSLRKLKTGTASVAVAVAVLGAGFANQTEVKAEEERTFTELPYEARYKAWKSENDELRENYRRTLDKFNTEQGKTTRLEEQNKKLHSELASVTETLTSVTEADDKKIKDLTDRDKISSNLLGNAKDQINKLTTEKDTLAEKAKKLEEDKQISDASRKSLSRDLEASREAKKKVEADLAALTAEHQKLKEEKQISDASRQGLSRDLEASREAKKKVEADLAEANSKLQALEKLNKELEEGKKLSEKEKAELQARLEAEAKALKEQLAKQAEELAKLKGNQTPNAKVAPQANRSRSAMTQQKRTLPSTGEAANPFFTAAAATVMVSAGMLALKRKEEN
ncbi:TPA: YSIRK-type signal peptide-containing protein [Streptococcus pyogenes]|nr:YSIRK-type signal peptide-containing protein [Streptococcus pyogenes]HEQ9576116.1 YSIRK-type signal peptide-containing protein [Streptococcus pyogenes]HEQ9985338.1 YSIRK-type signal peptide-containing protein [Streptococcus pyogenes]HES0985448.1 YSIRK-type signal peptide-containing protein [Streptococcus pyogenes]HES5082597.1 YSIRK-type signal peptide-containing protein [Streptococcus pyogenes]